MSETVPGLPGVKFLERANNTPEQVREALLNAIAVTRDLCDAEPSADAIFAQAAALISSKQVIQVQQAPIGIGALPPLGNGRR